MNGRRGLALLLATVGLLAAAPPIATAIVAPEPDGSISINASPNPITFGGATTISGKLSAPSAGKSPVTLEANPAPFTAGFQSVATTSADADGNYSFRDVKPELNTRYRTLKQCQHICPLEPVLYPCILLAPLPCPPPGEVSAELLVKVRIRVTLHLSDSTPAAGKRVRFFGTAAPAHDGAAVHIQWRRWRAVGRAVLTDAGDERSRFSTRIAIPRDGTYRARGHHDADHAGGMSNRDRAEVG